VLEVKRKPGETFESLLRRFTKKTIQSGKILQAKKIRFHQKAKTDRARKESALMREDFRKKAIICGGLGSWMNFWRKRKKVTS
jgi:ribosomal protein S21